MKKPSVLVKDNRCHGRSHPRAVDDFVQAATESTREFERVSGLRFEDWESA